MVECQLPKLKVAGSSPVSRSIPPPSFLPNSIGVGKAHVAQSAERVLGKDEVSSSILLVGSIRGRVRLKESKKKAE